MRSRKDYYLSPYNCMAEFVERSRDEIRQEALQRIDNKTRSYAIWGNKGVPIPDLFKERKGQFKDS